MAEAAAFKLLGPVAIDLLKKGYSYLGLDVDVDEKLHDLQNIIVPQIEMAIETVENSPHKDRLRGWLKSMEEAVYEAEDELDLQDYYLLEQKVKSNAGGIMVRLESLPPIEYLSKIFNIKLKKSLEKLEKTAMKAKEFLPFLFAGGSNVRRSQTTNESRRRVTTSLLAHKVFGRDNQRDLIVDLLHETAGLVESESSSVEKRFSIVAIVGLGGAGKTTLAQYVCDYEKKAEANYFDVMMWVHVSQIFDVEKLTREMVESASGKECPNLTNLDNLQRELENSIRSKKFLLILDDVWNEKEVAKMQLEWEQLLVPLSAGDIGSKILMTTREKGVAKTLRARNILDLAELEKEDFLSLFTYYAFDDNKIDDEELKKIVEENAPKLHGSPLAARMVGSQLCQNPNVIFWKKTLSGELLEDTRKSLLWSYQNLDAPLQRCFSYCSLFLKGDNIKREELIHMWIAEGFVKSRDENKKIEDVGQEYFNDLLSSSFFQPTKDDGRYSIHDLLHDLAETVSKDRCLRVEGNLTNTIPQEIRHLSLHHINGHTLSDLVEKICNLKNLRTLIIFMRTSDDHNLHSIFVKLKKLRVVHLKIHGLPNLPESIGGLKHLRYLYFYGSSSLPISIYTLYHLEFLYIPNSGECRLEAKALANWINLQHLYFEYMILNVVGIDCWKQLGNRRNFHGRSIDIKGLENVKEKREVTTDIMDIEKLCLEWSTTDNNSRSLDMDVQVLEGFHPTPKLHDLTIVGYQGCVLPSWMVGDRRYFCLKLYRCRRLKQLPILPPTLTQLELDDCSSLPIVSKKDLAIIKSDVRISQVVTFMEGFDATYGGSDIIASELPWDERHGYDSQKVHNWLEKTMDIVYQIPQEEEEAQLVLPSSLKSLHIKSCPLTDSTLREGLSGLTFLVDLEINSIVSLTSLPSADVMECLTMLEYLTIGSCWFLTSLGGLQALRSLKSFFISFCPNLSAEGGNTSVLPSSLEWLEIYACHWKNLDDSQPDLTSSIDSKSSDNIPFAASLQLGHLKLLTTLGIANCPNIGSLLGLQELNILKYLTLIGCPKLAHAETKLASLKNEFETDAPLLLYILLAEEAIASLPGLSIIKFKKESFRSEEERVFQHLTSLKTLWFGKCNIKSLPNNLETLSTLTSLFINECPNIKSLPNNLETVSTLTRLDIDECPNIKSLPDLPRSLFRIDLTNCNWVLKRRCQEPHGKDWPKIAHIPRVSIS